MVQKPTISKTNRPRSIIEIMQCVWCERSTYTRLIDTFLDLAQTWRLLYSIWILNKLEIPYGHEINNNKAMAKQNKTKKTVYCTDKKDIREMEFNTATLGLVTKQIKTQI